MAENIRVAKFDFDTDELTKRLINLKQQMGEVRGEMNSSRKAIAELSQWHRISAEQVAKLEKENKTNTRAYQNAKATLDDLTKSLNEENGKLVENEIRLKNINAEYRVGTNVLNSYQKVVETTTTKQDEANKALQTEITSIAVARANNTQLLAIRNQLNPAIEEEAKLIEQLNERLNSNNDFIKENASAYEQQKMNIGNYRNDIIEASNDLNIFNGGLVNFIQKSQQAGGVGNFLSNSLSTIGKGIVGVTKASWAFVKTPLGIVITAISAVLGTLITYFKSTQEGIDAVTSITRPLSAVFETLIGIIQQLGKFLVDAFLNPKKYLTELYDYIKDKVMRQFQGLYDVVVGIATLDFDQAKKGLNTLGEVAEDVFNDAKDAVNGFIDTMDEAWKKGQEIDRLQKEIERREIDIIALRAESERQLKEQELIARDTSKSTEERKRATEEIEKITKRLVGEENKILDAKIKQLEIQQSMNDTSREDEAEMQRLLAERMKSDDRITDVQRQNIRIVNQIRNQEAQKAKQQADEAYQREITRMNESLNLWIAQQGVKARTLEEELEIERKFAEDSIKILDYQLRNKKISQEQYATEVLNIQNELAMMTNQLVVENAERELAEFMRLNEERLEKGKIYSDEEIQNEKDKLAELERLEREYVQLRLDNGLINKLEFDDAMLELDKKYLEERNSLYETYDTAQRVRELADRDLQHQKDLLDMEERGATEFERKQYQIDQQHQMELEKMLERAEAEGWTEEMINEAVNLRQQEWNAQRLALVEATENQIQDYRIKSAQNTANMLGVLAGRESALGKAVAIASVIQEKAKAISNIWANLRIANAVATQMSPFTFGQPWVGINTAFAVAETGATVGMASKSINEIRSAGTKKMYTGGFTGFGGKFETAPVEIHREEFVLNAEATRRIGLPALYAMNSGASNNGFVQDSIMGSTVNIKPEDIIAIAEGVARGASVGSAQGIRDLSTDREIMNNSKF